MQKYLIVLLFSIFATMTLTAVFMTPALADSPKESGATSISKVGKQPDEPQYGGELVLVRPLPILHFDDAAMNIWQAPTLALTNEDLLIGDWTKGLAGSGETTWLYNMMPSPDTLVGGLAKNWEINQPDTIVFHIRQGVHFHDKPPVNGREMTAEDVVFSLNRLWDTPSSQHNMVVPRETHIKSITTQGKWKVIIECYPGKLVPVYEWVSSISKIVPPEVIEEFGDMEDWQNSNGTGPFILTEYVSGSHVIFTRNQSYWMRDPFNMQNTLPYLETVKWYIIPDKSTRIAALRAGIIDILNDLEWGDAESLMVSDPELEWIEYPRPSNPALFMRVDPAEILPFDDVRVRRAMALAIDNEAIKDIYYGGHADVLSWPIMHTPEFIDIYTPLDALPESASKLYGYNLEEAENLMAEAGYIDGFGAEVVVNSSHMDMATIIQAYLANIDIEMTIMEQADPVWRATGFNRTYDQMYMSNVISANPYGFVNLAPGMPLNFSIVDDPVINTSKQLIDAAYFNEPERKQLIQDIVPYILEQSYILVPPAPHLFTTWQPWVKGYRGEYFVGNRGTAGDFPRYIWVDSSLK